MRKSWMTFVLTLACLAVADLARAQSPRTADGAGMSVDMGLRFGALAGLTATAPNELLGYETTTVGVGELEPAAWPVTVRTTIGWTFLAVFRVVPSCVDDPSCALPQEERTYSAVRAFGDLLWYATPRDSRLRPFVAGGVGMTAARVGKPNPQPPQYCHLPACEPHDPFFGSRADPALRGAAGVDVRMGLARIAAEVSVGGSATTSHDDRPVPGWNNAAVLSVGTRVEIH